MRPAEKRERRPTPRGVHEPVTRRVERLVDLARASGESCDLSPAVHHSAAGVDHFKPLEVDQFYAAATTDPMPSITACRGSG